MTGIGKVRTECERDWGQAGQLCRGAWKLLCRATVMNEAPGGCRLAGGTRLSKRAPMACVRPPTAASAEEASPLPTSLPSASPSRHANKCTIGLSPDTRPQSRICLASSYEKASQTLMTAPYPSFTLSSFMISIYFKQNAIDRYLYQRQENDGAITYVLNYEDDAIIFKERLAHRETFQNELSATLCGVRECRRVRT